MSLPLDQNEILNYLKELKPELEKDGVIRLGIFGSYANKTANPFSDIDVFVETGRFFVEKFGFYGVNYYADLKKKICNKFKVAVDLTDIAGIRDEAKKAEFLKGAIDV